LIHQDYFITNIRVYQILIDMVSHGIASNFRQCLISMAKRARSSTHAGSWHTVATMPYDKVHPEKVIAGVYPGAQVEDHIRQFALGVHVDLGISQHTVEAATWIICWTERAIQNNDFNVLALYRVVYSLTKGHCAVTARIRGHQVKGPHLCWDEKQTVLHTAKVIFACLEEWYGLNLSSKCYYSSRHVLTRSP
jgi:hypothetical protein